MCKDIAHGGNRCAPKPLAIQSAARAARRARARSRVLALAGAPLTIVAASLAPGTGHVERAAALREARARVTLAEWFVLADSSSAADRLAAARLPCDDGRAAAGYRTLARDYNPDVRRSLALNPAAPVDALTDLAHDPKPSVQSAARRALDDRALEVGSPTAAAVEFHARMGVALDDTPHAEATRAAMRRPGWIAPEDAAPELVRVAAEHGARVVVHPGTIPGATGVVEIDTIRVSADEQGAGSGTRALRAMHALADRHGWTIALHPSADLGSDVERLRGWYAREGYAPSDDVRLRRNLADWIRYPEVQSNV